MDKDIKKQPLVSVIMPAYNSEKHIEQSVNSILEQTYKNIELIVVDDGSSDCTRKTVNKLKKSDSRIHLLRNDNNMGISVSLNRAIEYSKGKYIARLDSDDISLPERISQQVNILEKRKNVSICGTWAIAIDEMGNKLFRMHSPTGLILKHNYWKPSPFISSSVLMRKSVIKKYSFRNKFDSAEDYDAWVRILKKYNGFNIKKELTLYRMNPYGVSKKNPEKHRELSMSVFKNNFRIENLSTSVCLSLTCIEFKLSYMDRLILMWKIRKNLQYPLWFMLIDNLYYGIRRFVFVINTILNHCI